MQEVPCFPPGDEAGGSLLPTNLPEPYCVLYRATYQGSVGCRSTPFTRSVRCTNCFCKGKDNRSQHRQQRALLPVQAVARL